MAKKRDVKKKGKGRPVHLYKLTADLLTILKSFEKDKIADRKIFDRINIPD